MENSNEQGQLVAGTEPKPSAGAFEASLGPLKGYIRGRVLPYLPIKQDFEWANLTETNELENARFAYPPLPWIGARFKFEVSREGRKKSSPKRSTIRFSNARLFFLGDPGTKNYTLRPT